MRKNAVITCWLLFVFTSRIEAQSLHYAGLFPTIDHSGVLHSKLSYGLYYFGAFPLLNLRKPDLSDDSNFLMFYSEQSLTYNLTEKFSLTGSYVYQRTNAVYNNYVNENRFYAQATYKQQFRALKLKHRLRFDGRFVQNRITNKSPFTHRVRYLLGMEFPLKKENDKLYLSAYEELFFGTSGSSAPVYEENWAYVALGKKINKNNNLEIGLLYLSWKLIQRTWFNQYYLQLTWINTLEFRKGERK